MSEVIYEVNIKAMETIDERAFLVWLKKHIKDLERLPGFLPKSEVFEVLESQPIFQISVRYFLESKEALKVYYDEYAPKMRGDLPQAFQGKLDFIRRELQSLDL